MITLIPKFKPNTFPRRNFIKGMAALGASLLVRDTLSRPKISKTEINDIFRLTRRIIDNGEVSPRYLEFANTASRLVKEGKVDFEHLSELPVDRYQYGIIENQVWFNPGWLDQRLIEGTIIHELYHSYQDQQERVMMKHSMVEAEAYLVKADFLYHVKPELLHASHWFRTFPQKNNKYGGCFVVPLGLTKQAVGLDKNDPRLERIMTVIRKHYLIGMSINAAVVPELQRSIIKKAAGLPVEQKLPYLEWLTENSFWEVNRRPLSEQISCAHSHIWVLPAGKGGMDDCRFSDELKIFATAANTYWAFLLKMGRIEEADEVLNYYFIDIWKDKMDALIDNPFIDVDAYFDGIR